jgi:glycosyltransferase involved in cell wall biosynthesis
MLIVSVIIPTYNRAHLVGRAIRSVLDQTYQDFELIVVDDGSMDNTEEIVKGFKDPRIRYIHHEQNRGGAAARNTGIKAAQGGYIAFQDSDDEWLPRKLEIQMRVFSDAPNEVGVVYSDMWRILDGRKMYWHSPSIIPEDGIVYKEALDRVFGIGIGTALIKRECFNKIGVFDENLSRFIDFELFVRFTMHYHFEHINVPLVKYYDTGNSISTNEEALIQAFEYIYIKYYKSMDKKSIASFQFRVGNMLCQGGKLNKGKYYLFSAIRSYPLNIKYLVAAFSSLFGDGAYANVVKLKRIICPVEPNERNHE